MERYHTCRICKKKIEFTAENFYRDKTRYSGLSYECKKCKDSSPYRFEEKYLQARNLCDKKRNDKPRRKFTIYKSSAKRRGIRFDLTFEEFMTLWQKPCFYCQEEIKTIGIDRVINTKYYSLKNIVSCCWRCNMMKRAVNKYDVPIFRKILDTIEQFSR